MTKQSTPVESAVFNNAAPLLKVRTAKPSVSRRKRNEPRTPASSSTT